MVHRAEHWRWSSYRAMAGLVDSPHWLAVDWLLAQFSDSRAQARRRYMHFVDEGIEEPCVWQAPRSELFLGDERFERKCLAKLSANDDLSEVPRAQRRPTPPPLAQFVQRFADRPTEMAEAFAAGHYTLKVIAAYFRVHYSTVSRAVCRRRRQ